MIYNALLIQLNSKIEEEVVLEIGKIRLTCFASYCPYSLQEGKRYPVRLHLTIFDSYTVNEAEGYQSEEIKRLNSGYSYAITGRINLLQFESLGLSFDEEYFATEYSYFGEKLIVLKVDRLDVEFLPLNELHS